MFNNLSQKFSSIFSRFTGKGKISESQIQEVLQDVRNALLEADVPYQVVQAFIAELKSDSIGQQINTALKPEEQLIKVMYDKVAHFLGGQHEIESWSAEIPSVIMMIGLQGSGKTTTCGKLARYLLHQAQKRNKKRKILVASLDFNRPAAVDQLSIIAQNVGVDCYKATATNPVIAAQEIMNYSQKNHYEILIVDTAGRLHVDQGLFDELKNIGLKLKPTYKFLVLDAMTGQESLVIAENFNREIGFTHALLTKLDSDTRVGAAFAFKYVLKKDILFVGTGEKLEDLELYKPKRMASRIIGMGDMMTLVEHAQEKIKEQESEKLYKAMNSGRLTLEDFAQQLEMMSRLGSFSKIMNFMPSMGTKVSPAMMEQGEQEIKKFKAILSSMTKKERLNPALLDRSRKDRIAKGSGVSLKDLTILLERFEQTQQFVKIFKKMGHLNPFR